MQSKIAKPISRNEIRRIAYKIREAIGNQNEVYFKIIPFIENIMPHAFEGFNLEVLDKKELGPRHGLTLPEEKVIYLREDVYEGAIKGNGRDRLTCAHEVGHYFLHDGASIQLARVNPGEKLAPYLDPEWQANAFAGELLVAAHLVRGLNIGQISQCCGVSLQAAEVQYKSFRK